MESLTLSTPFTHLSSSSSVRNCIPPSKPLSFIQNHSTRIIQPIKCSLNSSAGDYLRTHISAASPQTAESSRRGTLSDVFGMLLRERIIFLDSEITDYFADAIISQLLLLDAKDPTSDIRLFINCSGGSLSATMAIYDTIQLVRADVSTVGLGTAQSTASIILAGGTKGKRFAMPNTRIMIHQPYGGTGGLAHLVEIQANELMKTKDNVVSIISECSGRTPEQVEKDIDRDRFMSPIEAVEYGLIDGVIDRDSIIPLSPVPAQVKRLSFLDDGSDPLKYVNPEIPDDEIY